MKISDMIRQGANKESFWAQHQPWKMAMVADISAAKFNPKDKSFQLSGELSFGVGATRYKQKFTNAVVWANKGVGIDIVKTPGLKEPWPAVLRLALEQGGGVDWLEKLKQEGQG